MSKHFMIFENAAEYNAAKDSLATPNVCMMRDTRELVFNKYVAVGHEYVDLGLPSGLKWATMNIGANAPEETGLYFAWGETQGYTAEQVGTDKNFAWNDYEFDPVGSGLFSDITKYNSTDQKTQLDAEDDAAAVNWGDGWRMPTTAEFVELLKNCTPDYTLAINGVPVLTLTSNINGNSIVFPYSGVVDGTSVLYVNYQGFVWSSDLYDLSSGCTLSFSSVKQNIGSDGNYGRSAGLAVRPVKD